MISLGPWRPVQDSVLFLFFFTSIWSLLFQDIEGASAAVIFSEGVAIYWRSAMALGTAIALVGGVIQFLQPGLLETSKQISRFVSGMYIERAGEVLCALNLFALAIGIAFSPLPGARTVTYIILTCGFVLRIWQLSQGISRVKQGLDDLHREVGKA